MPHKKNPPTKSWAFDGAQAGQFVGGASDGMPVSILSFVTTAGAPVEIYVTVDESWELIESTLRSLLRHGEQEAAALLELVPERGK